MNFSPNLTNRQIYFILFYSFGMITFSKIINIILMKKTQLGLSAMIQNQDEITSMYLINIFFRGKRKRQHQYLLFGHKGMRFLKTMKKKYID